MNCQASRTTPGLAIVQMINQAKPIIKTTNKPVKKTEGTLVLGAQDFPDSINAVETRKHRRDNHSIPFMLSKKPAASVSDTRKSQSKYSI